LIVQKKCKSTLKYDIKLSRKFEEGLNETNFKSLSKLAHFFNFHNVRVKARMAQV